MRIVFIVQGSSLHAARWVNQFAGLGWDLHIVEAYHPSLGICPEFREGTFHSPLPVRGPEGVKICRTVRLGLLRRVMHRAGHRASAALLQSSHEEGVARLLRELRPDVIHSLGLGVNWRNDGLPVLESRRALGGRLPAPWILSSWGTDLEVFGAAPENRGGACEVISTVDGFIAECERDRRLAVELGLHGEFLGFFPAFGGTDMGALTAYRQPDSVADRRLIVIKGRGKGDPIGRAMTVMKGLALCADALTDYRIAVLQATPDVVEEAAMLRRVHGVDIETLPQLDYQNVLRLVGAARAYIAVTINDGLPSALVEAMALGAVPIHSDLEPIREWITDGENGLLVSHDSPQAVATALRRVLVDDGFVEEAARRNEAIVRERLDAENVRRRAIEMYESVVK